MFKVNNKVNTRIRKLTIKVNNKSGRRSGLVVINFEIYPRGPIFGRKRIYGVAYIWYLEYQLGCTYLVIGGGVYSKEGMFRECIKRILW